MDNVLFQIVNGPLTFLNIFANIFFIFCLLCPENSEGLRQPVKLLLGSMVFCTTGYLVSLIAVQCLLMLSSNSEFYSATYLIMVYMAFTSMSTSVWLNFFYYTQIVPDQRALFTWLKRRIKSIIYLVLFLDRVLFLFDLAVGAVQIFYSSGKSPTNTTDFTIAAIKSMLCNNTTTAPKTTNAASPLHALLVLSIANVFLKIIYVFICLCVMVGSSCSTVRYLHTHMKSMTESGIAFSSPRLHSQLRVTITGVLQGILYFFTALWIFIDYFCNTLSSTFFDDYVFYTVMSLYMFGTTINLGIGQAVIRQRAANVWFKAQCVVKPLKP